MARKTPVEHYRSLPESAEDTGALIHEMKVEARKQEAEEQSGESDKKIMADAKRRGEKQIALAEHKAGLAAESVTERLGRYGVKESDYISTLPGEIKAKLVELLENLPSRPPQTKEEFRARHKNPPYTTATVKK